ncbi:hypothetical protein HY385_02035 [Candidatus Daviesbacteria bacterium]|nr:hypothetical protein [Candidatus Daviesbacteria bacterium]
MQNNIEWLKAKKVLKNLLRAEDTGWVSSGLAILILSQGITFREEGFTEVISDVLEEIAFADKAALTPPEGLMVLHRGGNVPKMVSSDFDFVEADIRVVNGQWWVYHGDIIGPISVDLSQFEFQIGQSGYSFDELAHLAKSFHQGLFLDIKQNAGQKPTQAELHKLQIQLDELGINYAFSSTYWDLLDTLTGRRFFTVNSQKEFEQFIKQQDSSVLIKRDAVALNEKLATKSNIQVLKGLGINDICSYVIHTSTEAYRANQAGSNCMITNDLGLAAK